MRMLEHQRFLVKLRFFVNALMLPGGYVAEVLVVAHCFSVRGLVLDAEVCAAGLVSLQRVPGQQFRKFEKVGNAARFFELLVQLPPAAGDVDILPELRPQRRG